MTYDSDLQNPISTRTSLNIVAKANKYTKLPSSSPTLTHTNWPIEKHLQLSGIYKKEWRFSNETTFQ